MTDGGPDHRLTYETVKASLVLLFMHLDLDMLIALRTAPSHSWTNPAERCMSILNLALQHVALDRADMGPQFEKILKNKASLSSIRNAANLHAGLQDAFEMSMDNVVQKVNDRFSVMSLKGKKITSLKGANMNDIQNILDLLSQVGLTTAQENFTPSSKSKDVKKMKSLQSFLEKHSVSGHYCFQIRKCREEDCMYCTINPIRDEDLYNNTKYLPEPTPDTSNEKYLPFSVVNGKELTIDKFRPSAEQNSEFNEEAAAFDKQHRDVFKMEKLRDVINCGECNKPRCVYSVKKTDRQQDEFIRQLQEGQGYVCGDRLTNDSLFVKQCINCTSDVETSYFSGKCRTYLPPVCVYCGEQEELLQDNDPYMDDLYSKFSIVRPLCSRCHANGKMAKTWGTKFLKKRKT